MGRAPCCDKANVKKGPWSPEEDLKLKQFIDKYGTGGNWISLPHKAGLKRCGKSCRLRWLNYLRPNIKHGEFSDHEDKIISTLFATIGSRWSIIAAQLPGRTDNDIKNYWNTKLKKKLMAASMILPFSFLSHHHHNNNNILPQPPFPSSLQTSSPPPASSSSTSYKLGSNYYSTCLTNQELPISLMPSNHHHHLLINNHKNTSTAQVQHSSLMGPMHYHFQVKNTTTTTTQQYLFGVGGEPSCSSSDGSCNDQFISYGSGGEQMMGFEGYNFYNGSVDHEWNEKQNGFLGETTTPLIDQYNFEEIN